MLPEYVEYWEKNKPACVGLSRIGGYGNRWCEVWANGTSTDAWAIWTYVPDKWITHNEKGICLNFGKNKRSK